MRLAMRLVMAPTNPAQVLLTTLDKNNMSCAQEWEMFQIEWESFGVDVSRTVSVGIN